MRRLIPLLLLLCSWAGATNFAITAVRIDGNPTAICTGNATVASGVLTATTGACFASGMVGNGIIFQGTEYDITAFTSSSVVTLSTSFTQATTETYSVLISACYNPSSCNGWVAEFDTSNSVTTGGTYALGFAQATNFKPSTGNIIFTCTSSGYTSAGAATTYTRTIYGTRQLRQAYPNFQTNDEVNATNMTLRIALSDLVYAGDTCTVQVAAGIYTSGANSTSALAGGSSVTNNSTLTYSTPRTIANWSRPGWQRITGSTLTLAAVGFQRHASNNLPLAAMLFTVNDAHNHFANQTVAYPTIDPTQGDGPTYNVTGSVTSGTFAGSEQVQQGTTGALAYLVNIPTGSQTMVITSVISGNPDNSHTWVGQTSSAVYTPTTLPVAASSVTKIIEYLGSVSTSTFTQADQLTACFRAYPWIGDETSIMDSCDQTVTGTVTSGTFVANEQVKQGTTLALAYLDNLPLGTNAPSMIIGSIISQTSTPDSSHTWVGQTSGAVFTPTTAPVFVNAQPTPLAAPQFYLYDASNVYSAAGYVDSSFTVPGTHTSGTFIQGEKVTQSTSAATAFLIDIAGANGAGPIHLGSIATGTFNATNALTWTGATSGAVFTQTAAGQTFAGVDTNACAAAESGGQPGTPCRTINGALIKMETFNNASSTPTHADACGTLFMAASYYNWTGSNSADSNTTGKCWANLTPATGVSRNQVVIQTQNGTDNQGFGTRCATTGTLGASCGTPLHLKNININVATGPVSIFSGITFLWFDNTVFSATGGVTAPLYQVTDMYFTQGMVPAVGGNQMTAFGGVNASWALLRGLDTTGTTGVFYDYTVLGTTNFSTVNQQSFTTEVAGQTSPSDVQPIFAFNDMYRQSPSSGASTIGWFVSTGSLLGGAIIQNVFENTFTNQTTATLFIAADNSTGATDNNIMQWDNTLVGGRKNRLYNEALIGSLFRTASSEVGELDDLDAIKTETFVLHGANLGNFAPLYGVGRRSSAAAELGGGTTGWTGTADFRLEFPGVQDSEPVWAATNANGTSTTNPITTQFGNGSALATTAVTMSGATATFTAGSAYTIAHGYALGNTFTAYGITPVGYNVTWTITGGVGTTSLTATSSGVSALGNATVQGNTIPINFFSYNNRSAFDGTAANTGYGDYRPRSNSNIINWFPYANGVASGVLPYDAAAIVRDNTGHGAAGAFEMPTQPSLLFQ